MLQSVRSKKKAEPSFVNVLQALSRSGSGRTCLSSHSSKNVLCSGQVLCTPSAGNIPPLLCGGGCCTKKATEVEEEEEKRRGWAFVLLLVHCNDDRPDPEIIIRKIFLSIIYILIFIFFLYFVNWWNFSLFTLVYKQGSGKGEKLCDLCHNKKLFFY